jgi:hypothetical protein
MILVYYDKDYLKNNGLKNLKNYNLYIFENL